MNKNIREYSAVIIGLVVIASIGFLAVDDSSERMGLSDLKIEAPNDGIINLKNSNTENDSEYMKRKIEEQIKSLQDSIKISEKMIGMKTVDQERLQVRINEQKSKLNAALDELSVLNK